MSIGSNQNSVSESSVSITEPDEDNEVSDDTETDAAPAKVEAREPRAPGQAQPGQKTGNRRDRRDAFKGVRDQLRDEVLGTVRNELGQFSTRFEQMLSQVRQPPQQPQPAQAKQADAFEGRLSEIDRAIQAEMSAMRNSPEPGKYDLSRYNQLKREQEKTLARAEAIGLLREMGLTPEMVSQLKNGQNRQPYDREAQNVTRFYEVAKSFPWVKDPAKAKQVGAFRNYLLNVGRPDSLETDLEAAAHVQNELNLAPPPSRGRPPTGGFPGQNTGGGGGRREVRLPSAVMNGLSPDEQRAVQAAVFSDDT